MLGFEYQVGRGFIVCGFGRLHTRDPRTREAWSIDGKIPKFIRSSLVSLITVAVGVSTVIS